MRLSPASRGLTGNDSGKASLKSVDDFHYVVTVDDVRVNGSSLLSGKPRKALIDTGKGQQ